MSDNLQVHDVVTPSWIVALVDLVIDSMTPEGPIGKLGYLWFEPNPANGADANWEIMVYPTSNEMVCTGKDDGALIVFGFSLNLAQIFSAFSALPGILWKAPVDYTGDLDGPEICLTGECMGKPVRLRLFTLPPHGEEPSLAINSAKGSIVEKPSLE